MLGIFNQTTIPALEQTMMFAQRRHELLAGNVANIDTPDYRSRDLDLGDFQNARAKPSSLCSGIPTFFGKLGILAEQTRT